MWEFSVNEEHKNEPWLRNWKLEDRSYSFVSLIHSLGSTADSCSLWDNTWPSHEFSWKLMFSIKNMQEVHGEALVTNHSRPHLPAASCAVLGESVGCLLTCVEPLSNIQGRDHSVSVMCCYHKQTNKQTAFVLGVLWEPAPFPDTFFPQAEKAPLLGGAAGQTSPDTRVPGAGKQLRC